MPPGCTVACHTSQGQGESLQGGRKQCWQERRKTRHPWGNSNGQQGTGQASSAIKVDSLKEQCRQGGACNVQRSSGMKKTRGLLMQVALVRACSGSHVLDAVQWAGTPGSAGPAVIGTRRRHHGGTSGEGVHAAHPCSRLGSSIQPGGAHGPMMGGAIRALRAPQSRGARRPPRGSATCAAGPTQSAAPARIGRQPGRSHAGWFGQAMLSSARRQAAGVCMSACRGGRGRPAGGGAAHPAGGVKQGAGVACRLQAGAQGLALGVVEAQLNSLGRGQGEGTANAYEWHTMGWGGKALTLARPPFDSVGWRHGCTRTTPAAARRSACMHTHGRAAIAAHPAAPGPRTPAATPPPSPPPAPWPCTGWRPRATQSAPAAA